LPFEIPLSIQANQILLASFPKSGNTWFRFVVANILSQRLRGEEISFQNLSYYSPEIKKDRKLKNCVSSDSDPIFLKTHFYNNLFFKRYKSVVLYREPENVFKSYYYYAISEYSMHPKNLAEFINHPRYGVNAWLYFYKSWLNAKGSIIVSYDDLIERPFEGFKLIFESLNYSVNDTELEVAISNSDKKEMHRLEKEAGDPNKVNDSYDFVGLQPARVYNGKDLELVRRIITKRLGKTIKSLDSLKVRF